MSIVLPHDVACRLVKQAGLPLNCTPTDIVAATDKPEGRLVVDVTRSRLNHIDKRQQLTDLYGPIIYPRHSDWCNLFASVRELFPDEQLYMFKADLSEMTDYEKFYFGELLDKVQKLVLGGFHRSYPKSKSLISFETIIKDRTNPTPGWVCFPCYGRVGNIDWASRDWLETEETWHGTETEFLNCRHCIDLLALWAYA